MNEKWLTPDEAAQTVPLGNADWYRKQLRAGRLRGSQINGRWRTTEAHIAEMIEAGTNDTRKRRRRAI